MKLRKTMALACALTLTATLFSGCGKKESDAIKIGVLAPLTGPVSSYGQSVANAVQLAFDEANAAGGVLGKQIEYTVEDEEGDPSKAVLAYDKLVSDGVVAILGDVTSKPTLSVAEKSVADNMPLITPTATAADITKDRSNVFRTCFLDPFQAKCIARYASETLGLKNIAILSATDDDYSIGIANAFKEEAAALGMTIVAEQTFASADVDFKSQLTAIAAATPEAVLVPAYYGTTALITKQAKDAGLTTTWLGGDGWEGTLEALDPADINVADNAFYVNHYSKDDPSEVVQTFVKSYTEKFNKAPDALAGLGYDAAKLLIATIEQAGKADSESILATLPTMSITGVTGPISYSGSGDPIKNATISGIENGKYTFKTIMQP